MAAPINPSSQLPPHSDNVEEELRRIHLALSTVFSPSAAAQNVASSPWWTQRHLADRYLTSFQGTAVSWMVCDRLLQEGDSSAQDANIQQQRRFFAAQTLQTKCRSDMCELPREAFASLRDSLLNHLQRYSRVHDALTTRLSMCIAALAVQMNWSTIVTELLANNPNAAIVMAILQVLPEECASDRLILLDANSRFAMRDHLVASATAFFSYLQSISQQDPKRVLETLHTWIRYVPIHPATLAESPLLQASVQALSQPDYLEPAADVVVEVLRMYPSHHFGNQGLVQTMIPLLSRLPFDEALQSDDEDVLTAYCRVVTEMGESYMSISRRLNLSSGC
jgi:transportin-3